MESERRTAHRKRASELAVIQFGEETGGIVCNVSEQGLGFQTVAPVHESGSVRLCISPNPTKQIEILGTVVWTDQSKRSGGLRFTEVRPETRARIRDWLTETRLFDEPDATSLHSATDETAALWSVAKGRSTGAVSLGELSRDLPPSEVRSEVFSIPVPNLHSPRPSVQASPSGPQLFAGPGSRKMPTVWKGVIIGVIVLAPMLLLSSTRREIGSLLVRLGQTVTGENNMQTAPYRSSPAPSSGQNPSEVQLNRKKPSAEISDKPASSATAKSSPVDSPAPVAAPRTRQFDPRQLPKADSAKRGKARATELWSEVSAGSIAAEVVLAELYVRGDGVPRNCEQARVLLKAAAKSGDLQAAQDLRTLKQNGCR